MNTRLNDHKESELIIRNIAQTLASLTALEAQQRERLRQANLDFEEERIRRSRLMLEYATEIEKLSSEAADLREKNQQLRSENVLLAGYIRKHLDQGETVERAVLRR